MHVPLAAILAVLAFLAQTAQAAQVAPSKHVEVTQWRSGLIEINEGWTEHEGDDLAWARPEFDDSAWTTVDIEDIGPARTGWRWFRKHVNVGPDHANARLLIEGGNGTYELYVNGQRVLGADLHSAFSVSRPTERVFALSSDDGDFEIALRTRAPISYTAYHLPLFLSVTLGGPTAIDYERQALESERLYAVAPTLAINLLLCFAGLGAFALFANQRSHREYLYLGIYLFLVGLSNALIVCQQSGALPTSVNFLFADPMVYFFFSIAQIEFTFSFAGRRVTRSWRIYETLLLLHPILIALSWTGHFPYDWYLVEESLVAAPVPLVLPVLLWLWYRRGNREAAWLILPSMLPAGLGLSSALGSISIYLGWVRLDFLANPIQIGPYPVAIFDIGTLLFLLAIAVVMFFRFTRVSREQAHAAAELEAAREVQQRLVPPATNIPGFTIESAYLPATQVGGDFFHIRTEEDSTLLVVVGDVSGKGLPAAMGVSAIIGALRAMPALPPSGILGALNRGLIGNVRDGFVTCCALQVMQDGAVAFANAGHIPPYRNAREVELDPSLPLGLVEDAEFPELSLRLRPGDRLTLLSDGVVEARNASGELFGFERTLAISGKTAEEIAQAAQAFGQEDDITVVTLKRDAAIGAEHENMGAGEHESAAV